MRLFADRRVIFAALLALVLVFLCAFTPVGRAQRLQINGTLVMNSAGVPMPTGQICWQPVGNPDPVTGRAGKPINYMVGGGGQSTSAPVCLNVGNGAFNFSAPNTAFTVPANVCFHVTSQDPVTNLNVIDDPCVQPSSLKFAASWCNAATSTCNFNNYHPRLPGVAVLSQGPQGIQGVQGPQGLPGNAGTLATPNVAGVLYLPTGGLMDTLSPVALSGMGADLVGAAISSGAAQGVSADGTAGSANGSQEAFYFDGACQPSTLPPGFTYATGTYNCFENALGPSSGSGDAFALLHSLQDAGGVFFPAATQYAVQFQAYFGASSAGSVGFNASVQNTDAGPDLTAVVSGSGFGINNSGGAAGSISGTTYTWPAGGNNSTIPNSTDSGAGGTWAAPAGGTYEVSLLLPNDGSAILSAMPPGRIGLSFFSRTPVSMPTCASPCGPIGSAAGIQNFEIHGSNVLDRLGPVAEMDGASRTEAYLIPHRAGYRNLGVAIPFALNAAGVEGKYDGSSPTSLSQIPALANGNVGSAVTAAGYYKAVAYVPPSYLPHANNKWAIFSHGYGGTALLSLYQIWESGTDVADALYQAGYTVVILDNTVLNCYGNAQCVADVGNVMAKMHSVLDLAPQPYLVADSMGALQLFNAVAHGVVNPPAILCVSCNISLASKRASDAINIEADFGYSVDAQYPTATSGYDPLLSAQAADPYLPAATQKTMQARLLVPTLLVADPADPTVNTNTNSTFYFNAINALRAGTVTADFSHACGHAGPACITGPQAVAFFNQF